MAEPARNRMQSRRLSFREALVDILQSSGQEKPNLYYDPPESVQMKYPAIIYSNDRIDNRHADNSVYQQCAEYLVTVVDLDPDSEISYKVSLLPRCSWNRSYVKDNLHHFVYTIYYS